MTSPGWPEGSRVICRRERRHPGAQLTFTDIGGHRFQAFMTDQTGEPVALEVRHRARARIEDTIRAAKDTGLRNLPFREFAPNAAWLELVLIALDLTTWTQTLLPDGELAACEPKRLRYRLLHVAGRLTRSGRRHTLASPEGLAVGQGARDGVRALALKSRQTASTQLTLPGNTAEPAKRRAEPGRQRPWASGPGGGDLAFEHRFHSVRRRAATYRLPSRLARRMLERKV